MLDRLSIIKNTSYEVF